MSRSSDPGASPKSTAESLSLDVDDHRSVAAVTDRKGLPPWLVGVAGLAIGVAFAIRILLSYGLDPTLFVSFGDESPVQDVYIRPRLGDVSTRPGYAPDGKFFFVQANDPWVLDPEHNAAFLDRPIYRTQRMLYPLIAGGFGLFTPPMIVWAMLVTNLVAMAIGAGIAARLASVWGGPSWLGLMVPLNVGLLFELELGGAGILAYAFALAGVLALTKERTWLASTSFAAAALTREMMMLFPVGLLVLWWLNQRRIMWRLVTLPTAAIVLWHLYVRIRLRGVSGVGVVWGGFAPPFYGILTGSEWWLRHPYLLINVGIIAMLVVFVPVALRSRSPMAWGALPFVALATVLSENVWREAYDLTRVLMPVFTAIPFVVVIRGSAGSRSLDDGRREAV
jgi:hypothetical protein